VCERCFVLFVTGHFLKRTHEFGNERREKREILSDERKRTVTSREFNIICHMNRVYNLSESTLRELIKKKNRGVDDFTAHFFYSNMKKKRTSGSLPKLEDKAH